MIYNFFKKRGVELIYMGECHYEVEIPEKIMGEKVRIESIGPSAFRGRVNVKEICLPTSIKRIEENAFSSCSSLRHIIFADPSNLKTIGKAAFNHCSSLKIVQIPDSVETIEWGAFNESGVEKIIFTPNSKLTEMCSGAFSGCKNLQSITIPKGVVELPPFLFTGCSSLKEIKFMEGSNLRIIKGQAFERCPNLKRLVLPNRYIKLEDGAFLGSDIEELVVHPSMSYYFKNTYTFLYSSVKRVFSTIDRGLLYLKP